MVFEYDKEASNYASNVTKIYKETKPNEDYKYIFRVNNVPETFCISSKIYKGNTLLMPCIHQYIYCYNFGIYPENHMPSGFVNNRFFPSMNMSIDE